MYRLLSLKHNIWFREITEKYLYALTPCKDDKSEDLNTWQGRVKTIEDKVKIMMDASEGRVKSELREQT